MFENQGMFSLSSYHRTHVMLIKFKIKLFLCSVVLLFIGTVSAKGGTTLEIGQSEYLTLTPSMPSNAWITSTSWTTDVAISISNGCSTGALIEAYGYWEDVGTVSCTYYYSYTGVDGKVHVNHNSQEWYFTCIGYEIKLSTTSVNMNVGDTYRISFSMQSGELGIAGAKWYSSDKSIAAVYEKGVYDAEIRAYKSGTAIITCDPLVGPVKTCIVKVSSFSPTSIIISPADIDLAINKKFQLEYTLLPEGATSQIFWSSSNSNVASVNSSGLVTGLKEGNVTIMATTENGLKSTCKIKVVPGFINPRGPVSTSLSGSGSNNNPYLIQSASDLRYLADKVNSGIDFSGKYFKQTQNIVINSGSYDTPAFKSQELWIPIGNSDFNIFRGIYDGNHYTISGIYLSDNEDYYGDNDSFLGLFGHIGKKSEIKNLELTNCLMTFDNDNACVGAIVGCANDELNTFSVANCHLSNSLIYSKYAASGVVGDTWWTKYGEVSNCSNSAYIQGNYVGGIINMSGEEMEVHNCLNDGHLKGTFVGGIMWAGGGWIHHCYNSGLIESDGGYCAGILAHNLGRPVDVIGCLNYGDVKSPDNKAGAIFGYCQAYEVALRGNVFLDTQQLYYRDKNNNTSCLANQTYSLSEMKSSDVLTKLNNSGNSEDSHYVKGKNGFPVFDWYASMLSGIQSVNVDNLYFNQALDKNIYNLQGQIVGQSEDDLKSLPQGMYIYKRTKIYIP